MSSSSSIAPMTLQQCEAQIDAVRLRIAALSRTAAMRAQQLAGEYAREIPQPDWIATIEAQRAQQERETTLAHAELARLIAIRDTLLREQAAAQQQ